MKHALHTGTAGQTRWDKPADYIRHNISLKPIATFPKMRLLRVILLLLISCQLLAQGEIDSQDRTFWRNERSFGGSVYSNGWSLDYCEYRQVKPDNRIFIEAGLGGYKDPKEIKRQNPGSPFSFVYGKINLNWHLNATLGYQHEIFEKRDLGGVSIGMFIAGGPVVTFCKPIYYKVATSSTGQVTVFEDKKFDITTIDPNLIYGKSSIFKGINEIKLIPGLYAHGGFNFEYSHNDKITKTIEVGTSISAYLKEIPIMAKEQNKQIFFSLYASYKIGFIIDPLKMRTDFLMSIFTRKERRKEE